MAENETGQNQSTTPPLAFHKPTATVDIEVLWQRLSEQIVRERALFLRMVDDRERLLGISPRTAEIRDWWRKKENWIIATKQKPPDEGEVIVCLNEKDVTVGHYFKNGDVWRVGGEYTYKVTRWMYLPNPPNK